MLPCPIDDLEVQLPRGAGGGTAVRFARERRRCRIIQNVAVRGELWRGFPEGSAQAIDAKPQGLRSIPAANKEAELWARPAQSQNSPTAVSDIVSRSRQDSSECQSEPYNVAVDELVSCVVATRDRPRFFRQLVRCFLRQTYRHSELIVVDDGERPVAQLRSRSPRVRYVRLSRLTPTGTKLNIGIKQARGTVIQKLDDDDYYHPDFLKLAVSRLPDKNRAHCMVGWDCFLVLLAGEARVRHSGHGWVAGGTFCFSRKLWERAKFRDVTVDEDDWFLRDLQPEVVPVCAPEHYILVRHGNNTWKRMRNRQRVDDFFRGLPEYGKPLEDLVDPDAQAFYRSLARGKCVE